MIEDLDGGEDRHGGKLEAAGILQGECMASGPRQMQRVETGVARLALSPRPGLARKRDWDRYILHIPNTRLNTAIALNKRFNLNKSLEVGTIKVNATIIV